MVVWSWPPRDYDPPCRLLGRPFLDFTRLCLCQAGPSRLFSAFSLAENAPRTPTPSPAPRYLDTLLVTSPSRRWADCHHADWHRRQRTPHARHNCWPATPTPAVPSPEPTRQSSINATAS